MVNQGQNHDDCLQFSSEHQLAPSLAKLCLGQSAWFDVGLDLITHGIGEENLLRCIKDNSGFCYVKV